MSTKQVICPSCSTSYEVPAEYIGQSLQCGNCGCDFTPTPAKRQQPEADAQPDTDIAEKRAWEIHAEEIQLPRPGASILLNFIAALAFCAGVGGAILSVHLLGMLAIIPAVSMASAGLLIAGVFWGLGEIIIYLARINHNVKKMREEL
jgi:hypothetical protein